MLLKESEQKLIQQKVHRESLVRRYQELSSEATTINITLSTKQARLEDVQQRELN